MMIVTKKFHNKAEFSENGEMMLYFSAGNFPRSEISFECMVISTI